MLHQTLRKRLKSLKINFYFRPSKPKLTKENEENRLNWVRSNTNINWKNAIFLDESSLEFDKSYREKILRPLGKLWSCEKYIKKSNPVFIKRYVKLLSYICLGGNRSILEVDGRWTGKKFEELLNKIFTRVNIRGKIIVMDNDTVHKSGLIQTWARKMNVKLLRTPVKSCDLNIIEKFFYVWKKEYYKIKPKVYNKYEVIERAREVFF